MKRTAWWILILAAVLPLACDDGLHDPITGPLRGMMTGRSASTIGLCDATYLSRSEGTITVLPTGTDDTRNIQCALDAAMPGDVVQLVAADYHTAQIVVVGFEGTFRGAGADKTVIRNLPGLIVTARDLFTEMPGPDHTWPSLLAFWEGNLTVSNLAIKVSGEEPTTGWSIFGLQLHELAHAIVVLGRTAQVRVHDVLVEAGESPNALFGTNLINGIYPEGAFGGNPDPMTGSFTVERSTFRRVADPMPYSVVDGFRVRFFHNTVQRAIGVTAGDIANSSVEYADNAVESVFGFWLYDAGVRPHGVEASDILVRNNRLSGGWGAFFEATFGPDVRCLLLGNNTRQTENGLFFGAAASACTVVGGGARDVLGRERGEAVRERLATFRALRRRS